MAECAYQQLEQRIAVATKEARDSLEFLAMIQFYFADMEPLRCQACGGKLSTNPVTGQIVFEGKKPCPSLLQRQT